MRDHVRFHSTAFTPATADPGQVNTERYGYALATWVAARLKERGFDADSPIPEDWGWLLGVAQIPFIINFFWSIKHGKKVESDNPWQATSLEWSTSSPPPFDNFGGRHPVVVNGPNEYGVAGPDGDYLMQARPEPAGT